MLQQVLLLLPLVRMLRLLPRSVLRELRLRYTLLLLLLLLLSLL